MINKINPYLNITPDMEAQNQTKADPKIFRSELKKALESTETDALSKSYGKSLNEIAASEQCLECQSIKIRNRASDLLNRLEVYVDQLTNPDISLKTIESELEQIKEHAGTLLKDAEASPFADPKLKSIVRQSAVTATTEYIKFQRGDYL